MCGLNVYERVDVSMSVWVFGYLLGWIVDKCLFFKMHGFTFRFQIECVDVWVDYRCLDWYLEVWVDECVDVFVEVVMFCLMYRWTSEWMFKCMGGSVYLLVVKCRYINGCVDIWVNMYVYRLIFICLGGC